MKKIKLPLIKKKTSLEPNNGHSCFCSKQTLSAYHDVHDDYNSSNFTKSIAFKWPIFIFLLSDVCIDNDAQHIAAFTGTLLFALSMITIITSKATASESIARIMRINTIAVSTLSPCG